MPPLGGFESAQPFLSGSQFVFLKWVGLGDAVGQWALTIARSMDSSNSIESSALGSLESRTPFEC